MDQDHLRTGDRSLCRFRFIKNPEFVLAGTKMIFREGRTKAVGTITKLFNEIPGQSSHNTRTGKSSKAQMHQRAQQANKSRTAGVKKPVVQQQQQQKQQQQQQQAAANVDGHAKQSAGTNSVKSVPSHANGLALGKSTPSNTAVRTAES